MTSQNSHNKFLMPTLSQRL